MFVPVVNFDQKPIMPTSPSRACRWIKSGKATPFWKGHIFCVRLNQEPSNRKYQPIAVGIDPGSKQEGFTAKSYSHTYLNIQADAITHVKEAVKTRREMRRSRRQRNTPYRACRRNRASLKNYNRIPPSAKARWQWKLSILNLLKKIFPITNVIVENVKAKSKGQKRWDQSFSPLEVGKNWFYGQIENQFTLHIKQGYETSELRQELGLKKSKNKMSKNFDVHCVDSWVLANSIVGGNIVDNKNVLCMSKIKLHRRQLHVMQPTKGNTRKNYGGTMSLGFVRGSLVKHPKYGIVYVGGCSKSRITVHSIKNGTRISRHAKIEDCVFINHNKIKSISIKGQNE